MAVRTHTIRSGCANDMRLCLHHRLHFLLFKGSASPFPESRATWPPPVSSLCRKTSVYSLHLACVEASNRTQNRLQNDLEHRWHWKWWISSCHRGFWEVWAGPLTSLSFVWCFIWALFSLTVHTGRSFEKSRSVPAALNPHLGRRSPSLMRSISPLSRSRTS